MSLDDCIRRGVEGGEIDKARGDEARQQYQQIFEELRPHLGDEAAAIEAGRRTFDAKKWEIKERHRRTLLAAKTTQRIQGDIESFTGVRGGWNSGAALPALWEADPTQPRAFENVKGRYHAIRGDAHRRLDAALQRFSRGVIGQRRNKAQLRNVVKEVFGENTGDRSASEIAKAWAETSEALRRRFNAAGGHIPKRDDWGMPQRHDAASIRKAGRTKEERYQAWRAEIVPRLALEKMVDETTGLPMAGPRLENALREAFDNIMTDGMASHKPTMGAAGRALANRRADHRFFVFKSADDWIAYQERFGDPDAFSTMMSHIDATARDIAQMEVLGPNPNATMRWAEQLVRKQAEIADNNADGVERWRTRETQRGVNLSRTMAAHFTGSVNAPADGRIAFALSNVRNVLTSAQLGAAALSAISDLSFQERATTFNGLSAARAMGRMTSLLNPANGEDRKLAVRLGLVAEEWSQAAAAHNRYVGEVATGEWAQRLSHTVMTVTGLSAWTQAGRWAFGMELLGTLADHRGKRFAELPQPLQNALRRYRLADEWDTVRATTPYRAKGAEFLRPADIAERADLGEETRDRLSNALADFVATETEYAVPSASLRARSRLIGDAPPGNFVGEMTRSAAMYKSFPITLMHTHLMRGVNEVARNGWTSSGYLAALMISTTLMGALSMNLKEISKGRDPRDMSDPKAWAAAALQGGGLGIWGDFLFSDATRYGSSWAEMLAGPVVGLADDVARETIVANVQRALAGEDTQFPADVVGLLSRYTPGSSAWQWRVALERKVWDQLEMWVDPDAARRLADRERDRIREFGNEYWWSPGEAAPSRGPELEAATGN